MEFGLMNVTALANLLKTKDDDSDSDDDQPCRTLGKMGPGDIAPTKKSADDDKGKDSLTDKKKLPRSKAIWEEEEVPEGAEYDAVYDPRPQPEYEIIYKQAVTSEDMFLQMGNKTPSSASCEDMIVKIQLPGAKMSDVQLDVKPKFLDCRTSKVRLGLHLPHPVDDKKGKAQWDGRTEILSVTLRIVREFDFLNF
ncbi:dynein assembly factor 6, axonemal-like [Gigantopelta aegis]|uniref:dynein assembly factor 6, axonemal-like n=1 Tax=Gigantopelta aegis TaxID=1735272 RepID=UPI001B888463|nr:dynein assembly factor 6, axonemal-like [Gigantopelta aegis]